MIKGLEKLTLINCGNFDPTFEFPWIINLKFLNELKHLKVLEFIRGEAEEDQGQHIDCTGVV